VLSHFNCNIIKKLNVVYLFRFATGIMQFVGKNN
jgi:hypothetical protein